MTIYPVLFLKLLYPVFISQIKHQRLTNIKSNYKRKRQQYIYIHIYTKMSQAQTLLHSHNTSSLTTYKLTSLPHHVKDQTAITGSRQFFLKHRLPRNNQNKPIPLRISWSISDELTNRGWAEKSFILVSP